MAELTQTEKLREKIARVLQAIPDHYGLSQADEILSIPEILIKDPDQSLPKSSFLVSMYESMLKPDKNGAVWVKVLPKVK